MGSCRPGAIQWIERTFADCVYNDRDLLGFLVGLASIACWMCAQAPQLYKNYKTKSAEALSAWFLAEWLLGDTFNLVGSLLKGDQPQSVVMTAQYFVCMDVVLLIQYLYYSAWQRQMERMARRRQRRHWRHHHRQTFVADISQPSSSSGQPHQQEQRGEQQQEIAEGSLSGTCNSRDVVVRLQRVAPLAGMALVLAQAPRLHQLGVQQQPGARRLLLGQGKELAVRLPPWAHTAGTVLGYASAILYLTSRVSQLYKNWKRQSVEGLAMSMFVFAIAANSLYGASLLIRSYSWAQLAGSLPWLLGSLGTVALDVSIYVQSRLYTESKKHQSDEDESLLAEDDKPSSPRALHL